jgi:hypothetical protein
LLLLFCLWTLWAARSVVHKSTGFRVRRLQVELDDAMRTVEEVEDAVCGAWTDGDDLAAQGLADAPGSVVEADVTVLVDFADSVAGGVFDRRQRLGKGSWPRPVTLRRRRHVEGFMRPLVVVQQDLRTPTGRSAEMFFIRSIRGSRATFSSTARPTRPMAFSAARWTVQI